MASGDKRRKRRPRSQHNRARSASRDRKSPELGDDFVINADFYDSIPSAHDGRTSRTKYQSNQGRYHRAKSQGAPIRRSDSMHNEVHQGGKKANLARQNSMPGDKEANKLEKYRQRAKKRDELEFEAKTPQRVRRHNPDRRDKSRNRSPNRVQSNLPSHLRDDYHHDEFNNNARQQRKKSNAGQRKADVESANERYHDNHDHRNHRNRKNRENREIERTGNEREVIVTPERLGKNDPIQKLTCTLPNF